MQIPHVIYAGLFKRVEKYSMVIPEKWIAFNISGIVRSAHYYPNGKLAYQWQPDDGAYLVLGYPGMRTDFEYDSKRENWVLMVDFPDYHYDSVNQYLYLENGDERLVLPNIVRIPKAEIPELRERFAAIAKGVHSALHQEHLRADLMCASLWSYFLELPVSNDPADTLKGLIDADHAWNYSISALSRKTGYNRDYLRREFQRKYGVSPGDYRIRKRCVEIMNLIAYSRLSLKEIAYRVGMKHVSHLNILLKREYSLTPSQLLKKYRKYTEFPLE